MNLSTFWKRPKRHYYDIVLKSGFKFSISCEDLKIEYNTEAGQITHCKFTNAKGIVPFHLSPLEIAGIFQYKD